MVFSQKEVSSGKGFGEYANRIYIDGSNRRQDCHPLVMILIEIDHKPVVWTKECICMGMGVGSWTHIRGRKFATRNS